MNIRKVHIFSLVSAWVAGAGLTAVLLFSLAGKLEAAPTATLYVNAATGNDANDCLSAGTACRTVGAAVGKAASGDSIQIAAGTYVEYGITISSKELTLTGAGAGNTILDGGGNGRIFTIQSTTVISGVSIQNSRIVTSSTNTFEVGGGAIQVGTFVVFTLRNSRVISNSTVGTGGAIFNNGTLILENTDVLSNTADGPGGGIYNFIQGAITITNGTIGGNTAGGIYGGGIYTNQPLYLYNMTVRDNSAPSLAGGVYLNLAATEEAVMDGVTFTGNQAASGAALFAQSGAISMTNSTVSGNNASADFGGIYISGPNVSLNLVNSTIAYNKRANSTGSGINGIMVNNNAVVTFTNSLMAYNGSINCFGTAGNWTSAGYNLSSDTSCAFTQTGDQQGVDPLLGPLADNGGATLTHALLPGSPAIDAGTNSGCPATDQRGIARPYDGDNDNIATCDIGAVEAQHQLAIADTLLLEGDAGTSTAVFTVTLSPTSTQIVTVDYATADGTAAAGSDYNAITGTLTFNPGDSTQFVSVQVIGDLADESDETFTVQLSNAANAFLLDSQATGTIVDNDGLPALTIADQTVLEGNIGTVDALFLVTLSPASPDVVTVDYTTNDGTAVAGNDFTAISGTLTFNPGDITQTITIQVTGDDVDEGSSESFTVDLSNPTNAKTTDNSANGTITDDDTARLTHNIGPQVLEGDSGLTPMVFTVTLSTPASFTVTVDYDATTSSGGNGGATAGVDFVPISGTLTFNPGETAQNYTVQINGDTDSEEDEVFFSVISNANVPISVGGSQGTILNDDFYVYLPMIVR
ncbi:MAG: Calx-beta domain-containing protein [Anaerolineae bacterium]